MTGKKRWSDWRLTPESAREWSLALYPAAILLGAAYILVTNRVSPDVIGMFIGLLTAASLQFAVKKNGGKDVKSSDSDSSGDSVHRPSREVLEDDDRGGTHNFDRWRDLCDGLFRRKGPRLSTAT